MKTMIHTATIAQKMVKAMTLLQPKNSIACTGISLPIVHWIQKVMQRCKMMFMHASSAVISWTAKRMDVAMKSMRD